MKRFMNLHLMTLVLIGGFTSATSECKAGSDSFQQLAQVTLEKEYYISCTQPTDMNAHVHRLRALAKECDSAVELGMRGMVSTWGILQGLSENSLSDRRYLGVDIDHPPEKTFNLAHILAEANGVSFTFWQANDLEIDIEPADMLFIDTLHTYSQLTYELETFSPKIRKYIAMHDTSDPFAYDDDRGYTGDYSEYPDYIDKNKRGTWTAVWDFLSRHPEWKIQERHFNSYGFTVLKRVSN